MKIPTGFGGRRECWNSGVTTVIVMADHRRGWCGWLCKTCQTLSKWLSAALLFMVVMSQFLSYLLDSTSFLEIINSHSWIVISYCYLCVNLCSHNIFYLCTFLLIGCLFCLLFKNVYFLLFKSGVWVSGCGYVPEHRCWWKPEASVPWSWSYMWLRAT